MNLCYDAFGEPQHHAREMDALGFQQIALAAGEKTSWTGCFALAP